MPWRKASRTVLSFWIPVRGKGGGIAVSSQGDFISLLKEQQSPPSILLNKSPVDCCSVCSDLPSAAAAGRCDVLTFGFLAGRALLGAGAAGGEGCSGIP